MDVTPEGMERFPWGTAFAWAAAALGGVSTFFTAWVMRLQGKLSDSEITRVTDEKARNDEHRDELDALHKTHRAEMDKLRAEYDARTDRFHAERRTEALGYSNALSGLHKLGDKLAKDLERAEAQAAQLQSEKLALANERLLLAKEQAAWTERRGRPKAATP